MWKFSRQSGQPPEVVLLDGWSGPTETSRSTSKNFRFQSYFAKQQSKFRPKRKWIVYWKRCFNRTMLFHFLLMIPLIMSVWFGKWKALIACVAAAARTHLLDHWYSSSSLRIAHVWYIKILTWLRGLLVIFLYLVWFSLRSSLFWKLLDNGVGKNLQFWP